MCGPAPERPRLAWFSTALVDVARIIRYEPKETRRRLLASYTKLVATESLAHLAFSYSKRKQARFMGLSIEYLDLSALGLMIREIYVNRDYFFISERDQPRIIDAGANIGLATLFMKQIYPHAHVIAFEPEPDAFAVLERNMRTNAMKNITLINKAVAAKSGSKLLSGKPGSLVTSLKGGRQSSVGSSEVRTVPLSEYIGREVDFVKLDVEGSELEVIDELARSGKLRRIRQLICEYHHHLARDVDEVSEFFGLLEGFGFGYQIKGRTGTPYVPGAYQDLLVYAYRKD